MELRKERVFLLVINAIIQIKRITVQIKKYLQPHQNILYIHTLDSMVFLNSP